MTFEEQLTRAFDTLTERLRGEINSHVRRANAELIAAAPYDRDPAVVEAARAELDRAVVAARQEAHQAGHTAGEEAARIAALAELEAAVAAARQEAHQAGHSAGAEAARIAALAELEAAVAAARQEAHQAGHSAGEEAARTAARTELESAVAAARREAHDAGLAAGIDVGLAEGREAGRAAALEEIQARAPQPTDPGPGPALMDAVRTIERARSLTEILDALVSAASSDAGRAEVWLHRGGGLHRWRSPAAGDGTPGEPATSPQNDRIIADALRTNAVASADGAVAVPMAIGGAVVAVLVAQPREAGTSNAEPGTANAERRTPNDEPRTSNVERRTTNVELLTRYAARSLEALTAFKTARALTQRPEPAPAGIPPAALDEARAEEDTSARRYARLLVSEIKLYHEEAVVEGRRDRDLATRLGGEIARARVMFEQRVPSHVRERADYFREELLRTLANGDASLLELRIQN
jgi:hypothetical protein